MKFRRRLPYDGCQFPIDPDRSGESLWGVLSFDPIKYSAKTGLKGFPFALNIYDWKLTADLLDKNRRRHELKLDANGEYIFRAVPSKKSESDLEVFVDQEGPYFFASQSHAAGKIAKTLSIELDYPKSGGAVVTRLTIRFGPYQCALEVKKKTTK